MEAERCLLAARRLGFEEHGAFKRALSLSMLGYCNAVQGKSGARELLAEGTREVEALATSLYEPSVRLAIGYGMLELDEPEAAAQQARCALSALNSFPARTPTAEDRKYTLYLLGESAAAMRHHDEAFEFFQRLQREHYPQMRALPYQLLVLSTRHLVNWLA